jgi:hypothetical protein
MKINKKAPVSEGSSWRGLVLLFQETHKTSLRMRGIIVIIIMLAGVVCTRYIGYR